MDAQAYLIRQGWSGPGNALNSNRRPGSGLIRPIQVSRNRENHGVGKKILDPTNQWWLRGFEEVLRGVAQDGGARTESESNSSTKEGSELYRFFVRGEELVGTIKQKGTANDAAITVTETTEVPETIPTNTSKPKEKEEKRKRKRSENVLDGDSSTEGPTVRKREEKHKKRKIKKSSSDPEQLPVESVPVSIRANDDNTWRKAKKEKKREKEKKKKAKENSDNDVNDEKHNGRKGKKIRAKAMISTEGYFTPISIEEAERPEECSPQTIKIQDDRKLKDKDSKVSDTDMSKSRRKSKDRPEKSRKDKSRKRKKDKGESSQIVS